MSKIALAEIQLLIADKSKELSNLYSERSKSLINTFRVTKDSDLPVLQNTPYEIDAIEATKKADTLENQIMILKSELTKANCTTEINYKLDDNSMQMTLQQGIITIKQMRESLNNIKYLGDMKEIRNVTDDRITINGASQGFIEIKKPTYSTQYFRDRYEKMNKQILKLEMAISSANYNTMAEIPEYFQ